MAATEKYTEFMGFDNLVMAEVTADDAENYTTGTVEVLAPAGSIKKSTEREQAKRSYDNQTYFIIKNEGDDTVELAIPVLPLSKEAKITGKKYDAATGALNDDGNVKTKYFAVGYRLLCEDGTYRYVWKLKGTLTPGDEESKSKEGTDSYAATLTYTAVKTIHKFSTSGDGSKGMVADERDDLLDYSKWFEQVVTPDNITTIKKVSG